MNETGEAIGPVRIMFDMERDLSNRLTDHCRETGVSKKGLLRILVRDHLDKQTSARKPKKGKRKS